MGLSADMVIYPPTGRPPAFSFTLSSGFTLGAATGIYSALGVSLAPSYIAINVYIEMNAPVFPVVTIALSGHMEVLDIKSGSIKPFEYHLFSMVI